MEYRSWISTLSGHLFFHLSEPWNYRLDRIVGDVVHFNEKIGDERYIGISLLADLRDFNNNKDNIPYTRIFFFGKTFPSSTDDGKNFQGTISFFSDNRSGKIFTEDEKNLVKELNDFKNRLAKLKKHQITSQSTELITTFNSLESKTLGYKNTGTYTRKIKFSIDSTGLIELGNIDDTKDATFTSNITEFQQAYYFIKFIFHNHTHHLKSQEDIIRLSKISDKITDRQFALSLISDIKKYSVELRNSRNGLRNIEGLLAYAKSLLLILEHKGFLDKETVVREEKYFNNLTQSLNITMQQNNIKIKETSTRNIIEDISKIFVILMTLIAPYAIIKSKDIMTMPCKSLDNFLLNDILPLYIYGFFFSFFMIVIFFDWLPNRENSWGYKKIVNVKKMFWTLMKKNHIPTIKGKSISRIITIRQYLYHRGFIDKKTSRYKKFMFTSVILISFIAYSFFN